MQLYMQVCSHLSITEHHETAKYGQRLAIYSDQLAVYCQTFFKNACAWAGAR